MADLALQVLRTFRSDGEILATLRSPPTPRTRGIVVHALMDECRFDLVQRAVERGVVHPEMRFGTAGGLPLLHAAVSRGAVELARYLIFDRGVDPTVGETSRNLTALHLATSFGHNEAALFLINDVPGVDVNEPMSDGVTPLLLAVQCSTLEVVQALVAKGADMSAKDEEGKTALAHAVLKGHAETAAFLVTAGADWDITVTGDDGRPQPLFDVAVARGTISVVKAIVRRMPAEGPEGAASYERLERAAAVAVTNRSLPSLKVLMEEGLDVAQVLCEHEMAGEGVVGGLLHCACQFGHQYQEMIAFLVAQGCDALAWDSFGRLPQHVAAMFGHLEVLQWLVGNVPGLHPDLGGGGNLTVPPGHTALYFAAFSGHLDVAKWLVEKAGADLWHTFATASGGERQRISEVAKEWGHAAVSAYLLEQEALALAAAEAAARAEEEEKEAAARRARNEKRRQKQKKAKARRQLGAGGEGDGGEGAVEEGEQEEAPEQQPPQQQEEEKEAGGGLESLAGALSGVAVSASVEEDFLGRGWSRRRRNSTSSSRSSRSSSSSRWALRRRQQHPPQPQPRQPQQRCSRSSRKSRRTRRSPPPSPYPSPPTARRRWRSTWRSTPPATWSAPSPAP